MLVKLIVNNEAQAREFQSNLDNYTIGVNHGKWSLIWKNVYAYILVIEIKILIII